MQTRVGQVRIRYRVPAGQLYAATLSSLQHVAQEKIADACDLALEEIFADDPTVYVLRKVNSRVAVLARRRATENHLAEQWGRNLCKSVVKAIVRNDDSDNLVRFENQSDFVSAFLTRLATGDAWDLWYFAAFGRHRRASTEATIISVLEANQDVVAEILTRLKRSNALDFVLNSLGASGQKYVWAKVIRGAGVDEQTADAFRIFVRAAFTIADRLSLWKHDRPSESEVLDSYWRTRPSSPKWTNGRSLAAAVNSLLRFMVNESVLDVSLPPDEAQLVALRELVGSTFDWLDTAHLFDSVMSIFDSTEFATTDRQFTLRPPRATPAQERILEELLARVQSSNIRFTANGLYAHENLLRLLTELTELTDGPPGGTLNGLLESIVMSAVAIQESDQPRSVLQQLQRGEVPTVLSSEEVEHLKLVLAAGEPARALVAAIVGHSPELNVVQGVQIPSECAGLFLLVRVIQDLRVAAALKECGCESIHPLLVGLATAIYPQDSWTNKRLDAGAAVWSGTTADEAIKTLPTLETLDWDEFISTISGTISAQRVVDAAEVAAFAGVSASGPYSNTTMARLNQLVPLLLKAWARWLPGLAQSSTSYLFDNFIYRPGTVIVSDQRITVHLDPRPLDEILKLAGYLSDTPPVSWLDNRQVSYRLCR